MMCCIFNRSFYLRDVNTVSRDLLGKILVHNSPEGMTSGIIVETEAYAGPLDKAAHTYMNRRTARTEIQFGPGGYAYIYLIYGAYYCFNIVASTENRPEAVLVRALEPVYGIELMRERRKISNIINLCNGPGKLCEAMGISKANYGNDLCGDILYIKDCSDIPSAQVGTSPRINIDYAEEYRDYLWRYYIKGNKYVSKVPRRYLTNSIY